MDLPKHSRWFLLVGLPLARAICWVILTLCGPFRIRGRYRIPKDGPVLVLANHISDLDPVVTQIACPRPIYFMAKSELFEMRLLGKVIRWFQAFPVKRGEPDRQAIKKAVGYLAEGGMVAVYPEGQLSETGELQELKPGIALIVRMAQCPVICLGLKRTNKVMPFGKVIPRPSWGWVTAEWGEPRTFSKSDDVEEILGWVEGQLRMLTGQELR